MPWLGKLLGGTLGFFLGGPLGMIAGAVFGHYMIDKASSEGGENGNSEGRRFYFVNTGYNRSQMVFFVGAFSMLAKLASADGQVSDAARRKVNEFMVNDLGLMGQSYDYAQSIFNQAALIAAISSAVSPSVPVPL